MVDAVEAGPFLVIALDDVPRRLGDVGAGEGLFLGLDAAFSARAIADPRVTVSTVLMGRGCEQGTASAALHR